MLAWRYEVFDWVIKWLHSTDSKAEVAQNRDRSVMTHLRWAAFFNAGHIRESFHIAGRCLQIEETRQWFRKFCSAITRIKRINVSKRRPIHIQKLQITWNENPLCENYRIFLTHLDENSRDASLLHSVCTLSHVFRPSVSFTP